MNDSSGIEDLMKLIAVIQTVKGLGGEAESQISTHEQVTIANRPLLALVQGAVLLLCGVLLLAALLLFTHTVSGLLDLGLRVGDYPLAWTVGALLVLGASWLVKRFLAAEAHMVRTFATLFLVLMVAMGLTAALLTAARNPAWAVTKLGLSMALAFVSLVLGYNQMRDLAHPYWRRSPLEDAVIRDVFPMLQGLLGAELSTGRDLSVNVRDPRFPIAGMLNGEGLAERFGHVAADYVARALDEDEDLEEIDLADPHAGNLVWFLLHAARQRDLSLASLKVSPAPTLPFREGGKELRLRKTMIRRLLARGSTEELTRVDGHEERGLGPGGWWNLGGQGVMAEWAVRRDVAVREAMTMWESVMGDAPLPDYWQGQKKRAA